MIHPTLNTESSPILVEPSFYNEWSKNEQATKPDHEKIQNTQITANGYVCLPTLASQINGYVPMVRLVTEPKPPVIPKNGSYVDMNTLSLRN